MGWLARLTYRIKNQMTLFYTLLCSFMIIIVLLVSINAISISFFRKNIKNEIIENSGLNLNTTVANYEKHIKLIRNFMLGYLFDNDTQMLNSGDPLARYDIVIQTQKELQHELNNSYLYIDNMIYFFKDTGLIIDKDGTRDAKTMFSKFYATPDYTVDFWNAQLESTESIKVYPSRLFSLNTAFERKPLGELMPILIKSSYDHRFGIVVLLRSSSIYDAFHQPEPGSDLVILDKDGSVLFSSAGQTAAPPAFRAGSSSGYEKVGNTYYFYRVGAETGFTYVDIVSDKGLKEQINRLNVIMVALLAVSLLISLAVSYVIARRFHSPLANMLKSVQSAHSGRERKGAGSRIKEFNVLSHALSDLSRSNQEFHRDLQAKNSLLQQFAYMTRLKKLDNTGLNLPPAADEDKPFQLVLFDFAFKSRFYTEISNDHRRAFNMYKALIESFFADGGDEALTLQLEKDQLLSIVFPEGKHRAFDSDRLARLVRILENDSSYCNITIAASPVRRHSTDFAEAYQDALDLIGQRGLGEDVQVVAEWKPHPTFMIPTPSEDNELMANLSSGSDTVAIAIADKLLDRLHKSGATARQFQDLTRDIVNRTVKVMYAHNIPFSAAEVGGSPYDQPAACHTLEQHKAFLRELLTRSAAAIRDKKSETDVMTRFVMEYVEANYGQDLSLDAIAHKLGITGPYLSTYFKEKTGQNISDYIYHTRMNKATEMLRETDLKIQEIASLVGYYTVASFNRVFKKHTGITPSEFRRLNNKWEE
ncbi:helix-turn-helix domain-containing protein [Cohnella sp. GCM10027633]|uniref:helix-turn-helix domain-containing protein n=1 Tax=unclassified Cohnella TaxID=2636738 RepID=UPI0036308BA1